MIYTITFNPAVDYILSVNQKTLRDVEVNRADVEIFKAGGKGINVSVLLDILGIPSIAVAVLGGFTGEFLKMELQKRENIELLALAAEGNNRLNVKIFANDETICVNGKGPSANDVTKEELRLLIENNIKADDWVLFCGAGITNITDDYIVELCSLIRARKAKVVIDREQLSFEFLKACRPYLIKPNFYELKILFNKEKLSSNEIDACLRELLSKNVTMVLLSLGAEGAILATKDSRYHLRHQPIKAVNLVGQGDVMLASFVAALSLGETLPEALKQAGAAALAHTSTLEELSLSFIEEYRDCCKVESY